MVNGLSLNKQLMEDTFETLSTLTTKDSPSYSNFKFTN